MHSFIQIQVSTTLMGASAMSSSVKPQKHVVRCWGESALKHVINCGNVTEACEAVKDMKNTVSITAAFERKGKGNITYSHRQHMNMEMR